MTTEPQKIVKLFLLKDDGTYSECGTACGHCRKVYGNREPFYCCGRRPNCEQEGCEEERRLYYTLCEVHERESWKRRKEEELQKAFQKAERVSWKDYTEPVFDINNVGGEDGYNHNVDELIDNYETEDEHKMPIFCWGSRPEILSKSWSAARILEWMTEEFPEGCNDELPGEEDFVAFVDKWIADIPPPFVWCDENVAVMLPTPHELAEMRKEYETENQP